MWIRRSLMLGCMLLGLSGCVTQQTTTTIMPDGSGTSSFHFGISQQMLALAQMGGGSSGTDFDLDSAFDEMRDAAADLPSEWQPTTQDWKSADATYTGIELNLVFDSPEMLIEQLEQSPMGTSSTMSELSEVSVERVGNEWIVKATVSAPYSEDDLSGLNDLNGLDSMAALGSMGSAAPFASWTLSFPGTIKTWSEQDAASLSEDQHSITYTFPFPQTRMYMVEIHAQAQTGLTRQAWIIIGSLVAGGLLLIGLGVLLQRRMKRPIPAMAGAATQPLAPAGPQWSPAAPATPAPPAWAYSDAPAAAPQPEWGGRTASLPLSGYVDPGGAPPSTAPLPAEPNPHPFD